MEELCVVHKKKKAVYCTDCKKLLCKQCPLDKYCRPDHKRVNIDDWGESIIQTRQRTINESMRLLSVVSLAEQSLDKASTKLNKLTTKEYKGIFKHLKVIQDKIEELFNVSEKLPNELKVNFEIAGKVKNELMNIMVDARTELKTNQSFLQEKEFEKINNEAKERSKLLIEVSSSCQSLMEFEGKVGEFFDSLKVFIKSFNESQITAINEFTRKAKELKHNTNPDFVKAPSVVKTKLNRSASFRPLVTQNKNGISLCFGSFLDVKKLASNIKPTEASISVFGLENELGSNEIISFFYELPEEVRKQINAVTFDHIHFKDLSTFSHVLKRTPCLTALRLLSCLFTGSEILYVLEKIEENGIGVQELVIENSKLTQEQSKTFVAALERTNISNLRINGNADIMGFVESLMARSNETLKQIDFGVIKKDNKIIKLLKELSKKKKIIYSTQ